MGSGSWRRALPAHPYLRKAEAGRELRFIPAPGRAPRVGAAPAGPPRLRRSPVGLREGSPGDPARPAQRRLFPGWRWLSRSRQTRQTRQTHAHTADTEEGMEAAHGKRRAETGEEGEQAGVRWYLGCAA